MLDLLKGENMIALIGNGINRVTNEYSWETLIQSLLEQYGNGINRRGKPYHLLYEEIVSKTLQEHRNESEHNILSYIAQEVRQFAPNKYHAGVLKKYQNIITTNYDYTFEKAAGLENIKSNTNELRYSLYRSIKSNNNLIWHIHGEGAKPNTLCVGCEHYSAYIQVMRNYIIENRKYFLEKDTSDTYKSSWLKNVFCDDIDIIGLDMNFYEIDLWWLLVYRSRNINRNKKQPLNKITYYSKKELASDKYNEKIEMIKANNIVVKEIDVKSYKEYYEEVLKI
jgi:hypothetical protein